MPGTHAREGRGSALGTARCHRVAHAGAGRSALIVHEAISEGAGPDQQDTLDQVRAVAGALSALGSRVAVCPLSLDLAVLERIAAEPPDLVFNLVESLGGSGRLIHLVPAVLEARGIPFTGSGAEALFLTSNKPLAKRIMAAEGIPTPPYIVDSEVQCDPGDRYIIKSTCEHASFGLGPDSVVGGSEVTRRIATLDPARPGHWFAERYIDGREFNLSILQDPAGPEVLPIPEMLFVDFPAGRPRIVDYEAKWDSRSLVYHKTVRSFADRPADCALKARLVKIALRCWRVFALRGYARVDFRVDEAGRPRVLEVNANPCLSPDAGFMAAARHAGYGFEEVIARIYACALDHTEARPRHVRAS